MLIAVGLGAKKAIAASAAIQWLLKDGVGRIARMTVATSFCQSFDSDLKVWWVLGERLGLGGTAGFSKRQRLTAGF